LLNETAVGLTHELAVTELLYIICRKSSMKRALEKFNYLKLSGYINIVSINYSKRLYFIFNAFG